MKHDEGLKLLYCNANGVLNKMNELRNCICLYNVDIVCDNETHLIIVQSQMQRFVIYRQDRDFKIDGCNEDNVASGG